MFYEPESLQGPVAEDDVADDVVPGHEAPDVGVEGPVPVVAEHEELARRHGQGPELVGGPVAPDEVRVVEAQAVDEDGAVADLDVKDAVPSPRLCVERSAAPLSDLIPPPPPEDGDEDPAAAGEPVAV